MARRSSLLALMAAAVTLPALAPHPAHAWRVTFSDHFSGTSLNRAEWSTYNSRGHRGLGVRRPSQVTVRDGQLVITAQMIRGVLHTGGLASRRNYAYGRYEFRVRIERDPSGTTSGVVMTWPHSGNQRRHGENDIWETGSYTTRNRFFSFIHFPGGQTSRIHQADATRWHTMRMDWWPGGLQVFRDGIMVLNQNDRRYFPRTPHHLAMQLDPNRATMGRPVRMYVDWVRFSR